MVSDPVLSKPASEYPFIGQSKVAVPDFFYKAILVPIYQDGLDQTGVAALDACADVIAIAFVIPNKACEGDFWRYAKSVYEAEEITGLDFFPLLEDDVENRVEAECDPRPWYKKSALKKLWQNHARCDIMERIGGRLFVPPKMEE